MKNILYFLLFISSFAQGQKDNKFLFDWWVNSSSSAPYNPTVLGPDIWLDCSDAAKFTSNTTGDNLTHYVNVATTKDANAYTSTSLSSSNDRYKPQYNGEAYFHDGEDGFLLGSTSTWNWLHDGTTDYTLYVIYKPLTVADNATPYKVFCTVNNLATNTSSNIGFQLNHYNRASTTNTNSIKLSIYNNAGGTPGIFEVISAANTIVLNEYNILKVVFNRTSPSLKLYVKNSLHAGYFLLGQDLVGTGLSASNSVTALQIGGAAGDKMYMKTVYAKKSILTTPQETALETWLDGEVAEQITVTPVYVSVRWGQSNLWGIALNSAIATNLSASNGNNGRLGGYIFYPPNNTNSNKSAFWAEAQTGVTTNPSVLTQHGALNRFSYNMAQDGTPTYAISRGVGSTYLIPDGVGASWSTITTIGAADFYPIFQTLTSDAIDALLHVMRKRPVFRDFTTFISENDMTDARTLTTQAKFQDELIGWLKNYPDYLISLGVPRSDIRFSVNIVRAKNYSAYLKGAEVSAAMYYVRDNFASLFPSYTDVIRRIKVIDTDPAAYTASGIHYDAVGMDSIGRKEQINVRPYKSEN